jgi:predicted acyl esterase
MLDVAELAAEEASRGPTGWTQIAPSEPDGRAIAEAVTTRDGVRLATDIYLPDQGRRLPTILLRTPYDKGKYSALAEQYLAHGYALVLQDVRGKFRSEGAFNVIHDREVEDGYDTLDWIANQPWSDGAVGMVGASYMAAVQYQAAVSGHRALRAIVPTNYGISPEFAHPWDVAEAYSTLFWLAGVNGWRFEYDGKLDWNIKPLVDIVPASSGHRSRVIDEWYAHGRWPSPYRNRDPYLQIRIPVLFDSAWWDLFQRGQIADYQALRARTDSKTTPVFLLARAADHSHHRLRERDEEPDPPYPDWFELRAADFVGPTLDFLDRFVARRSTAEIPTVRWELAGVGWQTDAGWPPQVAEPRDLFLLHTERALEGPEGGLLAFHPGQAGSVTWKHDPQRYVPSFDGDEAYAPLQSAPADESRLHARNDVLSFTSEAVDRPLDICGPVWLRVRLQSSAPSTHLMAQLVDVYPDGYSRAIVGHARTVSPADGHDLVALELGHAGYRLRAGHSLRLAIASSSYPHFVLHPGTAENPWTATTRSESHQTLHCGEASVTIFTLPRGRSASIWDDSP